ncbi:MAG: hypothetical protein ACRBG0_03375 [Lewinella sp.]|uniref:hypothetical protein n=1 Tax=Lewinella sp. TaxID=2004506 RepID=UPI003D6B5403
MDDFKRREFIKLSALGFAGIALQLNSISSHAQSANAHFGKWNNDTNLNWDAFLERLTQLAKTQHQSHWNQKLYTEQVKQLLLQCNFPEFENIKKEIEAYENKTPNWFEAASLHREVDFQVSLFQFEKGEYIPHHDHPDMTGVINVVSGNILAKNYSVEEQLSTSREIIKNGRKEIMQKCTIREVGNEIVEGGNVSILTAHEGNIHSIMPNRYTQMIDVFTPAYKQDTNTIWYNVNEDGFHGGDKNVFEAEYVNKELSEVNTIKLSKRKLNRYVGSYKMNEKSYLRVFRKDNGIILERTRSLDTPGMQMKLLPYEQNKFWVEGQDIRCTFNVDNKASESLTLFIGETSITANKIK